MGAQLVDDTSGRLPRGKPPLSLTTKHRPRIRPGSRPTIRPARAHLPEMRSNRRPMPPRKAPGRTPQARKLCGEILPALATQIADAAVSFTQKNRHPVRQMMQHHPTGPRPSTQRAYRLIHRPPSHPHPTDRSPLPTGRRHVCRRPVVHRPARLWRPQAVCPPPVSPCPSLMPPMMYPQPVTALHAPVTKVFRYTHG